MPKRSNKFQKLVFLINKALHNSCEVTESAFLKDEISGQNREVDILISTATSVYPLQISIEVVDRNRKADVTWVESMHAKHLYLPTNKLVLVSRSGFTNSAKQKADFYGYEAIVLEEALEVDWDLAIGIISTGFFRVMSFKATCSATCAHLDREISFEPVHPGITVFLPYRDEPTDFENMLLFFLDEPEIIKKLYERTEQAGKKSFVLEYTPQPGTYVLNEQRSRMLLLKFKVELEISQTKTPVKFSVCKYKNKPVMLGSSTNPKQNFYFAFFKDPNRNGCLDGLVCSDRGIQNIKLNLLKQ